MILLSPKFIIYTVLTCIWLFLAPISLVLSNFFGIITVNFIIQGELILIYTFLISGIIINYLQSLKIRLIVTTGVLLLSIGLIFYIIPPTYQLYIPLFGSIIFAGIFGISYFLIARFFNSSWIGRMMMVGKSPRKLFMHQITMFLNILSFIAPLYFIIHYFLSFDLFDILLAGLGLFAWIIVLYSTLKFPNYPSYDIFASTFSATYIVVFLFFFLYIGDPILTIIIDCILLIFGLSALIQFLHSRQTVEKIAIYSPRSPTTPEDADIIIIQEDEVQDTSSTTPILDETEYTLEEEISEVRTHSDGFIIILLGLFLCFHFVILQFLGTIILGPSFLTFPFQYSLTEFHLVLLIFGYLLVICIFVAFKISLRFRGFTTRTMSEQAAFVKFLAIIAEEERKRLLKRISKMVKDILVGGFSDFIEEQRQRWREGFREGRKLLRRFFGIEEE